MGEQSAALWIWRGVFVLAVTAMLFVRILPISIEAGKLPGPDLLMVLCCAWTLRRPEHLPVLLIAAAVLVEDMLLLRPPGLWTAIMVLGTEFLRSRAAFSRELSLLAEWIMIATVMLAMAMSYRLIMAVTVLDQPSLGITLVQTFSSILAYPVVALILHFGFSLRRATGDGDKFGRSL